MSILPSLVASLEKRALESPDSDALVQGERRVSYSELFGMVRSVARFLTSNDLSHGDRVALLLENSESYVATYYGVLAAGGIAVGLNTQAKAYDLANWIRHAGVKWLFARDQHPELPSLMKEISSSVNWVAVGNAKNEEQSQPDYRWDALLSDWADDNLPDLKLDDHDPAAIIYTSGTTGKPKGVTLSHGNLAANTASIVDYLGLSRKDSILNVLPFYYSYGNSVLHTHIRVGAKLVIENSFMYPHRILERMAEEKVTGFSGVPSTYYLLLARTKLDEADLSSLRYMTQAGGPMTPSAIQQVREQVPHVQFWVMYGQTEATARLSYLPPKHLDEKLGSVGLPLPGTELSIQDEYDNILKPNQTGEICARGPHVMLGYWQNPEQSEQILRGGWLHTGDLGHCDEDGFFYIEGRSSDMIKTGAHRISPQEIEEVVALLEGVIESAALGVPDELLGQIIRLVVVRKPNVQISKKEVMAHCRQRLAQYKVPKEVVFMDNLPRTASGKLQRFKLLESLA